MEIVDNSGDSPENAIIILGAKDTHEGVGAEYEYLSQKYGVRGRDWQLIIQRLMSKGGKHYDKMEIELRDHTQIDVYFDISDFFGKF